MRWSILNREKGFKFLLGYFLITLFCMMSFVMVKGSKVIQHRLEQQKYAKKVAEANALLAMDAGTIGPLGGIKKIQWPDSPEISKQQETLRRQFISTLGLKPNYRKNPRVHIHSTQELGKGIQRKIFTVPAEEGFQIKGCIVVPPSDHPLPSIILAYGLGGTIVNTCGWKVQGYHNDMALSLAERGYLSVVYTLRGLGEDGRDWGKPEWGRMGYKDLVGYALQRSSSAMAIWVYDGIQVLRAMRAYPELDPEKVAFGGISHGGQVALYAGAIATEEIAVVISMGSFVSYEALYTEIHNWTAHAIPGIGDVGDMGDIAALVAPRPLLIQWGEKDSNDPSSQLRASSLAEFDRLRKVYQLLGVEERLQKVITPEIGHEFDVDTAVQFMDQFLR